MKTCSLGATSGSTSSRVLTSGSTSSRVLTSGSTSSRPHCGDESPSSPILYANYPRDRQAPLYANRLAADILTFSSA